MAEETGISSDFIREMVKEDLANGKCETVRTRFPPEPNGWLHIGHAKAIAVDFGVAAQFGGKCNLRFDDTNPEKEDMSYVEAIKRDVKWLGHDWEDRVFFASDYYDYLYDLAIKLIKKGKAYIDDLSDQEIREYRGTAVPDKNNITMTPPGRNSPYRDRSVEENLALFARMRAGEFPDGAKTLRAKIDMAHPNLVMRDPVMYRLRREPHYRTGSAWCIYPMYDFQHPLSDAKEKITHSLCSLEYEIHRPLYDWFINEAEVYPSRQIEFARLNITHTVLSKRWLLQLVNEGRVSGWDDPRMPTICGLRRRGYSPESIHHFIDKIGYTKFEALNDIGLLEYSVRESLNKTSIRVNAVINPVKLIITNYPEDLVEMLETINNPEDESAGTREIAFSKELYIEHDDFMEEAPKKFFRMTPGQEVRLKSGYIVKCTGCKKDTDGKIEEIYCEYDPLTKSGMPEANRKVKGTLHWVSAAHSLTAEVRLYDRLFSVENPTADERDFRDLINPDSLKVLTNCRVEASLKDVKPMDHFQFQRIGYFNVDLDSTPEKLVFNRTASLKDSWAKEQGR